MQEYFSWTSAWQRKTHTGFKCRKIGRECHRYQKLKLLSIILMIVYLDDLMRTSLFRWPDLVFHFNFTLKGSLKTTYHLLKK